MPAAHPVICSAGRASGLCRGCRAGFGAAKTSPCGGYGDRRGGCGRVGAYGERSASIAIGGHLLRRAHMLIVVSGRAGHVSWCDAWMAARAQDSPKTRTWGRCRAVHRRRGWPRRCRRTRPRRARRAAALTVRMFATAARPCAATLPSAQGAPRRTAPKTRP